MGNKIILIVGIETSNAQLLERELCTASSGWELCFAGNGKKALDAMSKKAANIVLTDIRLEDMPGPKFMRELAVKHPESVRLVLAGQADQELIMHSAGIAHQFLEKPCDPQRLRSVIESTSSLGDRLADEKVKRLVSKVERLPPVPALYKKVCSLLESEDASMDQIGRIISRDPGMSANVLKLVNSVFFSLRREVSDPAEAVAYLGIDTLKGLVLAAGLFDSVGKFEFSSFNVSHLWNHSMGVAFAAKEIAHLQKAGRDFEAECFTAGLLHDAGILILASQFPKDYHKIENLVTKDEMLLEAAEMKIFGVAHGDVGAYLMGLWGLPDSIVNAVAWHHTPSFESSPSFTHTVAVHAANVLVGSSHHPLFNTARMDNLYLQSLGLFPRVQEWKDGLSHGTGG